MDSRLFQNKNARLLVEPVHKSAAFLAIKNLRTIPLLAWAATYGALTGALGGPGATTGAATNAANSATTGNARSDDAQ
jgi:hypothetical protein